MIDPLSAALSSKKKDDKAKPADKKASATSLFGDSGLGGLGADPAAALVDVSAALGGARRNPAPGPSPFQASPERADPAPRPASKTFSAPSPAAAPQTVHRNSTGGYDGGSLAAAAAAPLVPAGAGSTFEEMLEGEKVAVTVKKCYLKVTNPLCEVPGRILCTNYRLKFQNVKGGLREELRWMQDCKYFDVPMGTLEELKVDSKTTVTGALEVSFRITTKDGRSLFFLMGSEEECRDVLSAVSSFGHPGNPTLLFAVKYCEEYRKRRPVGAQEVDGWGLYDAMQEYTRMGIDTDIIPNPSSPWKVSGLNTTYGLCSTYPSCLVLPRRMSDHEIRGVAQFRKRGRLPAMSWCGGPELNYAAVFRCSQTTEGLMGQKSSEDEKHVQCIRHGMKNTSDRDLLVIDLRPWKAAWANKAGGGGFEGYDRCNLIFGGIDNIHCVRDAWRAMLAAVNGVVDGEVGSWMSDVAKSNWYDYIGAILNCARKVVVEILQHKANVMVHCSDGWDRTAQTTSLAMLCIDPHYRTQAGFLKLIQKEWCSFGHKFRTRLALGEVPTSEASPVFVQWLEAVYQVVIQNPNMFEFTPAVLLRIGSEATSNRYGTFLTDCERERLGAVAPHTLSLWSILLGPSEVGTWRNPFYSPSTTPIIPTPSIACFTVWEAYWFRHHARGAKLRALQADGPTLTRSGSGGFEPAIAAEAASAAQAAAPAPRGSVSSLHPLDKVGETAAPAPRASISEDVSLFSAEEVVAAPRQKAKTFFQDDDDEEDAFANAKSRKSLK